MQMGNHFDFYFSPQVNSLPGFNLAVTILFSRFDYDKPKNFKDCNATTEKFTPLNEFDIDWMFPGKGLRHFAIYSLRFNFDLRG